MDVRTDYVSRSDAKQSQKNPVSRPRRAREAFSAPVLSSSVSAGHNRRRLNTSLPNPNYIH